MREVSQEEFFAFIKAQPGDPMPSVERPEVTLWKTRDQRVVARSFPGWRNPGDPKRYEVEG